MTKEDHAFKELIDDYIVECLPLAERVADTFVGSAKAFLDGNQMAVTYFVDKLAWPWKRRALLFGLAVSAAMLALLAWYGSRMTWDDYDLEVTSPGLGWPQWLYTVWLPLLSVLVLARIVQGLVWVWRKK